jgi:type I restriction enzyme S subunit
MSEQTKNKVPQIRFRGSEGEWEHLELRNVSEIKTGPFGSTLHASDYVQDGVPIVTTEHFKNWHLPSSKTGLPQVSAGDYERLQNYVLKYGDLVFSRVGSIDINAYVEKNHNGWLFSGRVLRVRCNSKCSGEYLHHELSTWRVRRSVATRSVGQTMPCINTEILGATPISVPHSPSEQIKIGEYFRELDSLIALHQRKHDKLVMLKNAMLQKMFPKPGSTTPEIRFKGFSAEWKQKKLGDIGLFYRGISYNSTNVGMSGLLVLRSSNIQNSKLVLDSDLQFIDIECPEAIALKKGDIAICMSNGSKALVGKSALCEIDPVSPTTVGAFCSIFRSTNPIAPYLLQTTTYSQYLNGLLAGSSINNLKNSDLSELILEVPIDGTEQQKIGTYFRTLDELISKHAIQLQELQQIKFACLEKMFV